MALRCRVEPYWDQGGAFRRLAPNSLPQASQVIHDGRYRYRTIILSLAVQRTATTSRARGKCEGSGRQRRAIMSDDKDVYGRLGFAGEAMYINSVWANQDAAWWAKANRAGEHIESLRSQVEEFRASEPCRVIPESTDKPGRLAYRLRTTPVPTRISATLGDVLHNLRAALENLAYGIGVSVAGNPMPRALESASAFPICQTPQAFTEFFEGKPDPPGNSCDKPAKRSTLYDKRTKLYDARAREALRAVQPFVNLEQAKKLNVATERSYEEETCYSELYRLNKLWNIDKHRRLALMAWWPDMVYWTSNGPSKRKMYPGDGTLENGSILYHMEGTGEGDSEVVHEFNLTITDDPGFSREYPTNQDIMELVDHWHHHIVNWVFPVVFARMSTPLSNASPQGALFKTAYRGISRAQRSISGNFATRRMR
jgi:hypothetical protein